MIFPHHLLIVSTFQVASQTLTSLIWTSNLQPCCWADSDLFYCVTCDSFLYANGTTDLLGCELLQLLALQKWLVFAKLFSTEKPNSNLGPKVGPL